jgi:hypothetical protein
MTLAGGRTVFVNENHLLTEEALGKFPRIADRRGGADENRPNPVKSGDPAQTAQEVREMGAENPAVRMDLVDDDLTQGLQEFYPLRMVRKDARMEHIGV